MRERLSVATTDLIILIAQKKNLTLKFEILLIGRDWLKETDACSDFSALFFAFL